MAARIRAIIERIKQEPGWLLVLLGLLTLYVTWKLYQHYTGGGQNTGGYVPTNGIDVPLYPGSVGGTPGNTGGSPSSGPGGMSTDYGQQLQDLLDSLGATGVVPSVPNSPSDPNPAPTPSTAGAPTTSGRAFVGDNPALWATPEPPDTSKLTGAIVTAANQQNSQLLGAIVTAANKLKAKPTTKVGDNPALWATPAPKSKPVTKVSSSITSAVAKAWGATQAAVSKSTAGAASASAVARHQNNPLGY